MARELIDRYSDYDVISRAPTVFNYSSDLNEVVNDASSGSASFKIYDPSKCEVILADEAIGQTELSVSNAGAFDENDAVEVTQNDESILASTVSSVDAVAGTITIADALTVAADLGQRVRVIFGASISMSEFGTADLNTRDWGYHGVIESTHSVHSDPRAKEGLEVDIEVKVTNSVRNSTDIICATIKEDDCD
jgi:hypothetical protein